MTESTTKPNGSIPTHPVGWKFSAAMRKFLVFNGNLFTPQANHTYIVLSYLEWRSKKATLQQTGVGLSISVEQGVENLPNRNKKRTKQNPSVRSFILF